MDKKIEVVEKPKEVKEDVVDDVTVDAVSCLVCGESFLDGNALELHVQQLHGVKHSSEEDILKAAVTKKNPAVEDKPPVDGPKEVAFTDLPDDAVLTVPVPLMKKELLWLREMPGFLDEVEAIRAGMRLLAVPERD